MCLSCDLWWLLCHCKHLALITAQDLAKAVLSDTLWAKCLLSHVCCLWYVLLPSHVSLYWNKTGVLRQALEIFEDMRKRKALSGDEVGVGMRWVWG